MLSDSAQDSFVQVLVGQAETPFTVHKTLLCKSSDYFKAQLKPEWSGTPVKAPHDSQSAFNIYVNWLYSSKITTTATSTSNEEQHHAEWKALAESYVVGEVLLDIPFKDSVIDALRAKIQSTSGHTIWSCGGDLIKIIYSGTSESSPARMLLADVYASIKRTKELTAVYDKAPKDFFYNVSLVCNRWVANLEQRMPDYEPLKDFWFCSDLSCKYHCHLDSAECYLQEHSNA